MKSKYLVLVIKYRYLGTIYFFTEFVFIFFSNLDLQQYKEMTKNSNDEVEKLQKTISSHVETIDQLRNNISEWKDKNYQLELELTTLKLSLEESVKNVEELEETKQNLNNQIETLESQKNQMKTDLEAGQFELKESKLEVKNLQSSR